MLRSFLIIFLSFPIQIIGQDTITMSNSDKALKTTLDSSTVKINTDDISQSSIYREQMDEVKILLSESIISDHTADTLTAIFNFKLLFESLAQIDEMNDMDEFEELEYNKILKTAVDYYEKKALTINKIETGLSVALLRDKLDEYIYDQSLEELEFVDELEENNGYFTAAASVRNEMLINTHPSMTKGLTILRIITLYFSNW